MKEISKIAFILLFGLSSISLSAQFSPGKLSEAHAEYEGLDNCTLCHEIGAQISEKKCLECHKELQSLIDLKRGYHSSKEVKEKSCIKCHSEHHGRKFDAVRFDQDNFNHNLTGYKLEAAHDRIDCRDCHKADFISDSEIAGRKETFLGLEESCLTCHVDYHQGSLGKDCLSCHNFEEFPQTPGFDHAKTDFPLKGAHQNVNCLECHPKEVRAGKDFQKFSDIAFSRCTDCHEDAHQGKFGQNCTDCHSEQSWLKLKNRNSFNHDLTDYPLRGMHRTVSCSECHSSGDFRKAMSFANCIDCHEDYHEGEIKSIVQKGQDCDACHSLDRPFTYSSYDWEDHENNGFPLQGAHLATPCFACHKESEESRWDFAFEAQNCVSCHENIHEGLISESYFPEQNCEACHNAEAWSQVQFKHEETGWALEGAHAREDCRECHFEGEEQHFKDRDQSCVQCHDNVHGDQFEEEGKTNCQTCHQSAEQWKADLFNHQLTEFPLEGRHAEIDCAACHKAEMQSDGQERVIYKIEKFQCIDCHGT